jgi:hypothetical protein
VAASTGMAEVGVNACEEGWEERGTGGEMEWEVTEEGSAEEWWWWWWWWSEEEEEESRLLLLGMRRRRREEEEEWEEEREEEEEEEEEEERDEEEEEEREEEEREEWVGGVTQRHRRATVFSLPMPPRATPAPMPTPSLASSAVGVPLEAADEVVEKEKEEEEEAVVAGGGRRPDQVSDGRAEEEEGCFEGEPSAEDGVEWEEREERAEGGKPGGKDNVAVAEGVAPVLATVMACMVGRPAAEIVPAVLGGEPPAAVPLSFTLMALACDMVGVLLLVYGVQWCIQWSLHWCIFSITAKRAATKFASIPQHLFAHVTHTQLWDDRCSQRLG